MTVQVATCSAAQLFSGALLAGHALATDGVVSSSGPLIGGELRIPEYQRPDCWQDKIAKHQRGMLDVLRKHYSQ